MAFIGPAHAMAGPSLPPAAPADPAEPTATPGIETPGCSPIHDPVRRGEVIVDPQAVVLPDQLMAGAPGLGHPGV